MKQDNPFIKWLREGTINEMSPVKMSGNAPFDRLDGESKSKASMREDYIEIGTINDNKVFKHKKFEIIKVSRLYYDDVKKEERWAIIAELSFDIIESLKSSNNIINKKSAIKIHTINVREANRRDGIASKLYVLLLSKGFLVISDGIQFEGAVKLWKSFTKIPGIKLYIWDEKNDRIISKMTANTHDNSIWSDGSLGDYSKMSTKLILSL